MDVANATTGLTLALRARGLSGARVGIPNGVCMQVPLAVWWSGNVPVWLDIDPGTLGLSTATLDAGGHLDAVIFTHAYGARGYLDDVAAWCRSRGVFLIDDRAPADPRIADPVADVTVASFGRGKLVDLGHGGRVLASDPALAGRIAALAAALPAPTGDDRAALDRLMTRHTALYNAHFFGDRDALATFGAEALPLERAFVHAMDAADPWPVAAAAAESSLDAAIARRAARASRYAERFAGLEREGLVRAWRPAPPVAWWRFVLFVPPDRQGAVLRRLLADRLPVSTWFPPADLFFAPRRESGVRTPVADAIGDTILNLWLTDDADIDHAADAVIAALSDHAA